MQARRWSTIPPPEPDTPEPPLAGRLVWFVALALGGAGVTAGAAYALRALLWL